VKAATLLQLMRLASPSLPVGGFSYSEGIESAVETGRVSDEATAERWLVDQLHLGIARSDLPVVAAALAAWQSGDEESIASLNQWFATTRESAEMRQQSEQMGRSLAIWLQHAAARTPACAGSEALRPAPTWPIAFALAAPDSDATARDVLVAFAAGWAENLVQATMKAVPLGQLAAQRLLLALSAEIVPVVDAALVLPAADMQAFTPMLAILSAQHETQYSRLFRS
jgi:urease accessory protein